MGNNITVSPWIYFDKMALGAAGPDPTPQNNVKTRLGLVGETLIGPAFQPTLIKNNNEFSRVFGGLSQELDGVTKFPRYELPYIATRYLNQANQLYVTRVLGLSGYDAGRTWGITVSANYDTQTLGPTVTAGTYTTLFSFTANSQNTVTKVASNDPLIQTLWDNGELKKVLNNFPGSLVQPTDINYTAGTLSDISQKAYVVSSNYTGFSINNYYLKSYEYDYTNNVYVGETSGITVYYSAATYTAASNQIVALLKSRADIDVDENLTFYISGGSSTISFVPRFSATTTNVYGNFVLNWVDKFGNNREAAFTFDKSKSRYLGSALNKDLKESEFPFYIDEIYDNNIRVLNQEGRIKGLNLSIVDYGTKFSNFKDKFKPSVTPWVLSQLKGSNISRLFRFWSKGDGEYTANQFKVSILNIRLPDSANSFYNVNKPDESPEYKFDVMIRPINDIDSNPSGEIFRMCSMNPKSDTYIGKLIGTRNGDYPSRSAYATVEINEDDETTYLCFPAGFLGYPSMDYHDTVSGTAVAPVLRYKTFYSITDDVDTNFLGIGDYYSFDKSFFKYKGKPNNVGLNEWSGMTKAFHMDVNAVGATIDGFNYDVDFEVGASPFTDEQFTTDTQYELINSRKFTFMPYGGFDGWNMHRIGRTNQDTYKINGDRGVLGEMKDTFNKITLSDNTTGLDSDYYAYLEGLYTFKDTDTIDINLFATPGIDVINHNTLVEEAIDLIENTRADSLYIVTTPDVDAARDRLLTEDIVDFIDGQYNSSYTATFWPWTTLPSAPSFWLPPTTAVIESIAKNDRANGGQLWFAPAGVRRGSLDVYEVRRNEFDDFITKQEVDYLYNNRINPIIYVGLNGYEGFKTWGNKTLATSNIKANRIHIRRLLLEARYLIIKACKPFLFEQNDSVTMRKLENVINPILSSIKDGRGITDFRLKFDKNQTDMDNNILRGKIYLKPVDTIEYMLFQFSIIPREENLTLSFNPE